MKPVVFVGPTLPVELARRELDALYLPPAAQSDIYRVSLRRPPAILLIDGYFERVPSVWHKEILWALREGVHVFGCSSMGALRAAELEPFGMVGVGEVFQAFKRGDLEGDDEVAVTHAPGEVGFGATSEALVNIRWTLSAALMERVIGKRTYETMVHAAKSLYYPARSYRKVIEEARRAGVEESELSTFETWLPAGAVDRKGEDAVSALRDVAAFLRSEPGPKQVPWTFEHTEGWDRLRLSVGDLWVGSDLDDEVVFFEALLDELRLRPDVYERVMRRAATRFAVKEHMAHTGARVAREHLEDTIERFRREHGLLSSEQVQDWLDARDLLPEEFERLMEDEARMRSFERSYREEIMSFIPDELRVMGEYEAFAVRARKKLEVLRRAGGWNPTSGDAGYSESDLREWLLSEGLHLEGDPARARYTLRRAGLLDDPSLLRAGVREYIYRRAVEGKGRTARV